MKPLATCQCKRLSLDWPCKTKATAEDFLCDPCREGCNAAWGSAEASIHMVTGAIRFEMT